LIPSVLKISKKTPYKIYIQIVATLRHDKFLSSEMKYFCWTDFWELNPEICIHFGARKTASGRVSGEKKTVIQDKTL
jgi:hypothetical protein